MLKKIAFILVILSVLLAGCAAATPNFSLPESPCYHHRFTEAEPRL